ncbi:MAG TPA: hypothetical protein VLJ57_16695 [Burkholderiaceae bacterium]|nr:hypothetical protein [Burkholderiaceae bacterium]
MRWHRRPRQFIALLALASLLFMQLAVASYACPGAPSSKVAELAELAAMAQAGMPCAETMSFSMDETQPNLCRAHCQAGQQTADKYEMPPLASAGLANIVYAPLIAPFISTGASLQAPLLRRATAPPLAVQHCCFRI